MTPGKQYPTTCVRASINSSTPPEWIPVIGPPHDDAKFIGFKPVHLHIDWRFLDHEQRDKVMELGDKAAYDLVITTVYIEGQLQPTSLNDALADNQIANHSFLKQVPKTYYGPFPEYPDDTPYWLPALSAAYRQASLDDGRICPHRGADLSDIEPNAQGVIVCPLHGLRWLAANGQPVPIPAPTDQSIPNH